MSIYTIIGGDQKEYGPISADDVRQWIAEGRLNEQSLVKGGHDVEFRPLKKFPEFAADFAPYNPSSPVGGTVSLERDYELDLGGCFTRGWTLVKNNFGTLFVSSLVMALAGLVFFVALGVIVSVVVPKQLLAIAGFKVGFNLFLSAVSALVMGPLAGGLYLVYLNTIRGLATGVGDVFAGFQKSFSQLFLGYLVVVLVTGLCMAPFNYVNTVKLAPLLAQMQNGTPEEIRNLSPQILSAFVSTLPILLICMIPVTYLSVNWLFTQSLIIDRQMDFRTAMKTSWKMVHKRWWHVFGLVVITGLLNVAGFLLCCVGMLFTIPIGFAALMFAYETIFAERRAA
jgi:MFS family permease